MRRLESADLGLKDQADELDERSRDLSRGGLILAVSRIVGRGGWFAYQVVAARALSVADFGVFALLWAILRVGGVLGTLGIDQAVLRYGPGAMVGRHRLARIAPPVAFFSALFGGLFFMAGAHLLGIGVFEEERFRRAAPWFVVAIGCLAGGRTLAAVSRQRFEPWVTAVVEDFIPPTVAGAALLVVAVGGATLSGAAGSVALGLALAAGAGLYLQARKAPVYSEKQHVPAREVARYSILASTASTFVLLNFWTDRLMLGALTTDVDVAMYQAAALVAVVPAVVLGGVGTMVAPFVAEASHSEDKDERVANYYTAAIQDSLVLSGLPVLLALSFPRELLKIGFGDAYIQAWPVLIALVGAQFINAATGPIGPTLVMLGRAGTWARIAVSGLIANIGLALWMIPRWGIFGAAFSTVIAIASLSFAGLWIVRRYVGRSLWSREVLRLVASITVLGSIETAMVATFRETWITSALGLTVSVLFVTLAKPHRLVLRAIAP